MILPPPSDEQQKVREAFIAGYNIRILSVAGSGKSTTLLHLSKDSIENKDVKALILTFNKNLQLELEEKARKHNIDVDVFTFHGYAGRIYGTTIPNNDMLDRFLQYQPSSGVPRQVVFIDEAQDLTESFYNLINKIITPETILVLVGDLHQSINKFRGAKSIYLTHCQEYFDLEYPWIDLELKTSYRLTPFNAEFVNKCVLNNNMIIGGNRTNTNLKPEYYSNVWKMSEVVDRCMSEYDYDDIVILMSSVTPNTIKSNTPVGKIIDSRSDKFYIKYSKKSPIQNEKPFKSADRKGKILIATFNSMKGCQSKCVIVVNFDESYFKYNAKDHPKTSKTLPDILYVVASRAEELLVIIGAKDDKNRLRTITTNDLNKTCSIDPIDQ